MQPDFNKLQPVSEQPDFTKLTPVSTSQSNTFLGLKQGNESIPAEYIRNVGNSYSEAGKNIVSNIQQGATDIQNGNLLNLGRVGLRTVGEVAGAAFSPLTELPIVKPTITAISKKLTSVPVVNDVISKIGTLAKENPEQAKDLGAILNIVSLGGGKVLEAPLTKEAQLLGKDTINLSKTILTPSEEAVQSKIQSLFQKSIKPTSKKTLGQIDKYQNDTLNALKTIKSNVDSLNITDASGELISGRTPQTINELAQAVDQTKKTVFSQYDKLAKQAKGVNNIDTKPIASEVLKVADNAALKITNPEVVRYAEDWAKRLNSFNALDTETTQAVIQNLNNNLSAFYRNPTYESASKVAVDAGIANNFRIALDKAIEGATGKEYQTLKNQYSSLKAIENDVTRALARDARKNTKGLLDYTDIFTGGQMLTGILSLNPAMFTKGAVERGFKEWFKFLNDPNRAVNNIFKQLDVVPTTGFTPESAIGKYIKNPKLGLSVDNIAKNITMAEKGTLRDYVDYVNGAFKSKDSKYISNLKRDAQEIADKYNFTSATKGDRPLANQIGQYLDSINYNKKINK